MRNRIETDSLGKVEIPQEAYYGISAYRDHDNVQIVKRGINRQMIKALAIVKKAAAKANLEAGFLGKEKADLIMLSCEEILNGRLHSQFITDLIEGASGAGMNVNANEVIANRANEMKDLEKGTYSFIKPKEDVNMNQRSSTVIPICGKIAATKLSKKLLAEAKKLSASLDEISEKFASQSQPASDQFAFMRTTIDRNIKQIQAALKNLLEIHLNEVLTKETPEALHKFYSKWVLYINKYSTEKFDLAKDASDTFQDMEALKLLSSSIENLSVSLSKIANDILFLSSNFGYNDIVLELPYIDNYSENIYRDQILEVVQQVSLFAYGQAATISKACESSYVKSHAFEPVILFCLFEMITYIRRTMRTLREKVIEGIKLKTK